MRRNLLVCLLLGSVAGSTMGQETLVPPPEPVRSVNSAVDRSGITFDTVPKDNLIVLTVEPGSPADVAGVKPGDTIVTVDEKAFLTPADLDAFLLTRRGEPAKFVVLRGNERREIVYVDRAPAAVQPAPLSRYGQTAGAGTRIGYDVNNNIVVIGIHEGSPAEVAGVQLLDRLLTVNGVAYRSTREFAQAIGRHRSGETIRLEVVRRGNLHNIDVVLDDWADAFDSRRRMAPGWVAIDDCNGGWTSASSVEPRNVRRDDFENPRYDPISGRYEPISQEMRDLYNEEDATSREIAALRREIRALRDELDLVNRRFRQEEASK